MLCNCGPATLLAVIYILDCGAGELPIDFDNNYHAAWLSTGVLGNAEPIFMYFAMVMKI